MHSPASKKWKSVAVFPIFVYVENQICTITFSKEGKTSTKYNEKGNTPFAFLFPSRIILDSYRTGG